jgi:hypothetical protein
LRLLVGCNCAQQGQGGSEAVMRRENGYHETRGGRKIVPILLSRPSIARTIR